MARCAKGKRGAKCRARRRTRLAGPLYTRREGGAKRCVFQIRRDPLRHSDEGGRKLGCYKSSYAACLAAGYWAAKIQDVVYVCDKKGKACGGRAKPGYSTCQ